MKTKTKTRSTKSITSKARKQPVKTKGRLLSILDSKSPKVTIALFVLVFGVIGTASVLLSHAATIPVRTKCSATSPTYKQWRTTITYGLANAFCIKDNRGGELVWQSDGNLVWYINGTAKWASGTNDRGKTFKLQSDANMVIYDGSNKAVWASSWSQNGWGTWWTPGITATGNCSFYIETYYDTGNHSHHIAQSMGCGPGLGGQFWSKQSFDPKML